MEYSISSFTTELLEQIRTSPYFPYSGLSYYVNPHTGVREEISAKHPKRNPLHLREAVFSKMEVIPSGENSMIFDIGSDWLELYYPHYHILQQEKYIKKRPRNKYSGKDPTQKVGVKKRDYENVSWNGKTFIQKYNKNVRGIRSRIGRGQQTITDYKGDTYMINKDGGEYLNRHYQWIDNMLDFLAPTLAEKFGMRLGRKQDSGLGEEYSMQEESNFTTNLVEILNSFD